MTTLRGETEPRDGEVTGSEIEAARLRLVADQRLGRETPEWIRRLAEAKSKESDTSSAAVR